jgi:predicted lipoprotein with Yx(FWY)xxD motif
VGDISLNYERLELAADSGLTLYTYTADPGSKSEEALRLLGSWAATPAQTDAAHAAGQA